MRFLVLHAMSRSAAMLDGVVDVELAFPRYLEGHQFLIHDCRIDVPDFVRQNCFDVVLVQSTVMDQLGSPEGAERTYRRLGFLRDVAAVKVALPQDDYWCSEIRDAWYCDMGFDLVMPVCPPETWPLLVPRFLMTGGLVRRAHTAYVTPRLRQLAAHFQGPRNRPIDVGYRAKGRPLFPNQLGYLKGAIGQRALDASLGEPWNLDISVDRNDSFTRQQWMDFLGDCKSVIGTPSGSSTRVRNHDVAARLLSEQRLRKSELDDIAISAVTSPDDVGVSYVDISPRNLEAAAAHTVQLLVRGDTTGLMNEGVDYLPLTDDCTNLHELMRVVEDPTLRERIGRSSWERLSSLDELQIEVHLNSVTEDIQRMSRTESRLSQSEFTELKARHAAWCAPRLRTLNWLGGIRSRSMRQLLRIDSVRKAVKLT